MDTLMPITREQLLAWLKINAESGDPETTHAAADRLLLRFIGDPEITEAFNALEKWYA